MGYSEFNQAGKIAQDKFRVLYICSASRSGSTLTGMFMDRHSQLVSLGEINRLSKKISLDAQCGCGDKLRVCAQWRTVFDTIRSSRGIDLIKKPYEFKPWNFIAINEIDHRQQTRAYRLAVAFRRVWMECRDHLSYSYVIASHTTYAA